MITGTTHLSLHVLNRAFFILVCAKNNVVTPWYAVKYSMCNEMKVAGDDWHNMDDSRWKRRYNKRIQRRREKENIILIKKNVGFQDVLCKLEDVWHISDDLVTDLEEITCAMYVSLHFFEAEVSSIDLTQFPPCTGILDE